MAWLFYGLVNWLMAGIVVGSRSSMVAEGVMSECLTIFIIVGLTPFMLILELVCPWLLDSPQSFYKGGSNSSGSGMFSY